MRTILNDVFSQKEAEISFHVEKVVSGYNGMKRAEVELRLSHLLLFSCFVIIFHTVFSYARGSNSVIKL